MENPALEGFGDKAHKVKNWDDTRSSDRRKLPAREKIIFRIRPKMEPCCLLKHIKGQRSSRQHVGKKLRLGMKKRRISCLKLSGSWTLLLLCSQILTHLELVCKRYWLPPRKRDSKRPRSDILCNHVETIVSGGRCEWRFWDLCHCGDRGESSATFSSSTVTTTQQNSPPISSRTTINSQFPSTCTNWSSELI